MMAPGRKCIALGLQADTSAVKATSYPGREKFLSTLSSAHCNYYMRVTSKSLSHCDDSCIKKRALFWEVHRSDSNLHREKLTLLAKNSRAGE